eukprot:4470452-Pyramimonas_sp.AAC.1
MEHRLAKAGGTYWSNARTLRGPGSFVEKLRAWASGPATSAAHGFGTWHLAQLVVADLPTHLTLVSENSCATSASSRSPTGVRCGRNILRKVSGWGYTRLSKQTSA